jgi:hypothetical protein
MWSNVLLSVLLSKPVIVIPLTTVTWDPFSTAACRTAAHTSPPEVRRRR